MTYYLKSIKKGLIALLVINLLFIGFISLIQACTSEDLDYEEKKFNEKIENSIDEISGINITNKKNYSAKSNNELENIYILSNELNYKLNLRSRENLQTFDDLINLSREEDVIISDRIQNDCEIVETFLIDEQIVLDALSPAITEAKNIIRNQGISDQELNQILIETGASEEDLVPVIMLFNSANNNGYNNLAFNNSLNLFVGNSYAQQFNLTKAKDCAIVALGLNLFDIARNIGETGFKAALKAALRGVGTKFLGPIGIAITIAEWAWCYGH